MGSCASNKQSSGLRKGRSRSENDIPLSRSAQSPQILKQIHCLKLIYEDLASRSKNGNLTFRTFETFFHLHSVLSVSLFSKFSKQNRNFITEKEFIQNLIGALGEGEEQKLRFMFQTFDMDKSNSLNQFQFLAILLSSPEWCVKQLIKNDKFLNYLSFGQICEQILNCKKLEEIIKSPQTTSPSLKYKQLHEDTFDVSSSSSHRDVNLTDDELAQQTKESNKKILKSKINFNLFNSTILVKYVRYIFEGLKLDKEIGQMKFRNFKKIMTQNPLIQKGFFIGFHQYLWKNDNGFPLYNSIFPTISDFCTENFKNQSKTIFLVFIRSSLIAFENQQMKEPLSIKNLEGISVKPIQVQQKYGFILSHFDNYYPKSIYLFQDETKQKQWLQKLSEFWSKSFQSEYKLLQKIGNSQTSQIYNCLQIQTNQKRAVKVIKKTKLKFQRHLQAEAQILSICEHPHIIKVHKRYETQKNIYIVLDLIGQSLDEYINTQGQKIFSESKARTIIQQLLLAICKIHSVGLIHRNISLQNIVIIQQNNQINVKIIDFGFAVYKTQVQIMRDHEKFNYDSPFVAPQILHNQQYDQKVDVFSLGIIFYKILSGKFPQKNLQGQIDLSFQQFENRKISYKAKDLIKRMLCFKQNRYNCMEALKHKWFL